MMILKDETKKMLTLSASVSSSKIFLGKKGLGKYTVAKTMAAEKLGVSVEKLSFEPSYFEISGGCVLEELRLVLHKALYKSLKENIVLIDEAEKLTVDAQNVLLKSIEEGKVTVFFITTVSLLDTIQSRCNLIEFSSYEEIQLEEELSKIEAVNKIALKLCGGCPGVYFGLIKDSSFLKEMEEVLTVLRNMKKKEDIIVLMRQLGLLNDKSKSSFFDKEEWQVNALLNGILSVYANAYKNAILGEERELSFYTLTELEECIKRIRNITNKKVSKLDCLETIMYLRGGKNYAL